MPPTIRTGSKANPTMPPNDTSFVSPTVAPINTSSTNPQKESPLFARIPGEIRDHIFDLALTAYPGKQEPFEKNAYYYRPGFRYADQRLDTALLRTCRRIYQEASLVPLQNYERVEWFKHDRGPSIVSASRYSRCADICSQVTSLHLFTQQFWLEDSSWRNYAKSVAQRRYQNLQRLKITIRHSDWWWWEDFKPLRLDPKRRGTNGKASALKHSTAADGFHVNSWGKHFSFFKGLKTFELELETVEGKRQELDEIVARAGDWRFPLGDGNELVLNPARTKRTGWHGVKLRKCVPSATKFTRGLHC